MMSVRFRILIVSFLFAGLLEEGDPLPAQNNAAKKGQMQELGTMTPWLSYDPVEQQPDPDKPMLPSQKPIPGPVLLTGAYYFGNADKETIPVLLLHGSNGSRRDFGELTNALTTAGFAVLTVDLRGHGKSVKRYEVKPMQYSIQQVAKSKNSRSGGSKPKVTTDVVPTAPASRRLVEFKDKDAEIMPKDYIDMARYDLPAIRDELLNYHDDGLCNMNRLVIIGIDRGAALAAYQAMQDWRDKSSPQLTKTLILIAPTDLDVSIDTAKCFHDNKLMSNRLAALFVNPQGDPSAQALCGKIRSELLGKNAGDEAVEARFQLFSYTGEKKVKTDKGETTAPMTWPETFANKEQGVTQKIVEFINNRFKDKEKEARWSRIK